MGVAFIVCTRVLLCLMPDDFVHQKRRRWPAPGAKIIATHSMLENEN